MNCIVTAGPTYEELDSVRRLTNFSSGKLGTDLADYLVDRGHHVVLLRGSGATCSNRGRAQELLPFSTTADLARLLQSRAAHPVDAVFHAAAVSDFRFGRIWRDAGAGELVEVRSGKLSTGLGPLMAELLPTPKIISELRSWFGRARLVGWKFEVEGTRDDAIRAGIAQIEKSATDACVVNGPAYGPGFGLVMGQCCHHQGDGQALFGALATWLRPEGDAGL